MKSKDSKSITRADARAYAERWKRVESLQRRELLAISPTEKFQQLCELMEWARAFGWETSLAAEEQQVRERWILLRRRLSG